MRLVGSRGLGLQDLNTGRGSGGVPQKTGLDVGWGKPRIGGPGLRRQVFQAKGTRDWGRQAARVSRGGLWAAVSAGERPGRCRAEGGGGGGGRLPRAQAGRARRLRPRGQGAGRPTWARSGAVGPGLARPRRQGSALPAAAAAAQEAASARPPSCSGSPRGALPRRGARSRAPARLVGGALRPRACGAGRKGGGALQVLAVRGRGGHRPRGPSAGAINPLHSRAL